MMIKRTKILNSYLIKFIIRIAILVFFLGFYLIDKQLMYAYMVQEIKWGITPVHILWVIFMVMMIGHIFPRDMISMAMGKAKEEKYEHCDFERIKLLEFVQGMNIHAWEVLLVWLFSNGVVGFFYLIGVLQDVDLLMLTVFYFLCDYICILIFCPFQTFIMKNRCCVNCRIYDWGHFMMFTPMLFIRNFFSWSLFFTSVVVLIRWELIYAKHPERFWYGSNKRLQCANCKDKICQIKRKVMKNSY